MDRNEENLKWYDFRITNEEKKIDTLPNNEGSSYLHILYACGRYAMSIL